MLPGKIMQPYWCSVNSARPVLSLLAPPLSCKLSSPHRTRFHPFPRTPPTWYPKAKASMSSTKAGSPANQSGPPEVPSGVSDEAALLAAFADVPTISSVHAQELKKGGKQDVWVTVTLAQRDMPSNKLRKFQRHVSMPAKGPPIVAPQLNEPSDALLHAPSPS
ncbi:hypothetical protein DUNSADRAFT_14524, partial [Dunaliella salina]